MYDAAAPPVPDTSSHRSPRKAVLLNGALPGDEALAPIEAAVEGVLRDRGTQVRRFEIRRISLAYCQGCFECWTRSPGLCKTDGDAGREIAATVIESDLAVCLTRVTFGGYSSEIKKVLDRMICLVLPFFLRVEGEVHHRRRYAAYPSIAAVGVMEELDLEQERVFRSLVGRNARNLHAPAHAVSVLPANIPTAAVHGRLEDDLEPVLRTLAGRAA